jgi:hypothetical protein
VCGFLLRIGLGKLNILTKILLPLIPKSFNLEIFCSLENYVSENEIIPKTVGETGAGVTMAGENTEASIL